MFLGQLLTGDILISDTQGRQVYAQSFFEADTVKIDMSGKTNGVYFLSLVVADNRVVKRFVKL